jgi:hypothetical protein
MRGRWIKSGPTGSEFAREWLGLLKDRITKMPGKTALADSLNRFLHSPRKNLEMHPRWKGAPRMALRLVGHPVAELEI